MLMSPTAAVMPVEIKAETSVCLPDTDVSQQTQASVPQPLAGQRAFSAAEMRDIHAASVQVAYSAAAAAAAAAAASSERKAAAKLLKPETHRLGQRLRAEQKRMQQDKTAIDQRVNHTWGQDCNSL